ncbi:hypothetical protein H6F74_28745 [Trichocoleus sp. FACHB-90]|uniref:hypothetical protein n=1 Tax=Cyanophyceae TaxID=3028117 RepID=UPI00168561D6|nr:hypothetical protein [Trichocoleus sp. FACHB-90]MBD1930178.1 hypothetical protein [Trichocoleus sp. FACHB-90]
MKVFTYSGNPLAINLPQWMLFLKESVKITQAITRDKIPEIIVRNRNKIHKEWEEIKSLPIGRFDRLECDSTIYFEYFKS